MSEAPAAETALRQARVIAAALVAGPVLLLAVATAIPAAIDLEPLVWPSGLVGLVAPVVAYRSYALLRERVDPAATLQARCAAFVRATLLALAVSEAVALAGVVVFWSTRHPASLTGLAMHLLVAGAVWPSGVRQEVFLEGRPGAEGDPS